VADPERYPEFVRNMEVSSVTRRPDGTLDHHYRISYIVETIYGNHRYVFLPGGSAGGAPPIEMYDPDDNGVRHYRWEFLPYGGGTIVVMYGYTPIPQSGIMAKLLARVPTLEYGLALIAQMTWQLAMKPRAEKIAGKVDLPQDTAAAAGAYGFLLERGLVALLHARGGRLVDISMIDNSRAPADVLMRVAGQPGLWSQFVPSITASTDLGQRDGVPAVELEQSLPLMSWRTVYGVRVGPLAADLLGLSGDLRGVRMRWDVRPGPSGKSQLVLRTNQAFDRSSVIIRQLYRLEPLFEYGVDVGLGMIVLRGVKEHAEGLVAFSFSTAGQLPQRD